MHGDFSRWFPKLPVNHVGILAQEGRLLIDADVNAQSLLGMRWQDLAARAAFGAGIAAIPADALGGWQVVQAQVTGQQVTLQVNPGLAWADGLLVELPGKPATPVSLVATSLGAPIQTPPTNLGAAGTRDAVVLEVWRRALSGFQAPAELIEPALGGPDTAERIETAFALRLYRLAAGDDCRSIVAALRDDLSTRGKLLVTLAPLTTSAGDCPVVQGGGYSGFEHDLYRIEIANVDSGVPSFTWSQWNGGLVGRGTYDAPSKKLTLTGNDQAIRYSGLTSFYLEALVHDATLGRWRVAYGARATFDANGLIDLSGPASFGVVPAGPTLCFRIWNDLRPVSDFPAGAANELRDGIRLEFDLAGVYVPDDYWTFAVRAGGLDNPSPLVDHAPPFGVHHHRVVLAELDWQTGPLTVNAGIEDCRIPLHPVTATDGCCTHSVGDGITSHGDFATINAAIAALPPEGGRVCVLPGEYTENVFVQARTNVEILGCGPRSKIVAVAPLKAAAVADPVIHVLDSRGVRIEALQVVAGLGGIGILFEADALAGTSNANGAAMPLLDDMHVIDCVVHGGGASCIEIRGGTNAVLRGNRVLVSDQADEWSGITVLVQGARIERNHVEVVGQKKEYTALGGIWLRGGCVDIDVLANEIIGGIAHGVMLGHVEQAANPAAGALVARQIVANVRLGYIYNQLLPDDCVGCGPGNGTVPPPGTTTWVAGDPLRNIRIKHNSISQMGMAGIGVFGFFTTADQGVITIYDLEITDNRLFGNLGRRLADIPDDLAGMVGYGAISLADVIQLTIRDNEITRNGTAATTAVCGVFIAAVAGLELSRNRIYDNGPTAAPRIGSGIPHGGVWIDTATEPVIDLPYLRVTRGRIAAAIRDNEIQAPNGPALVMNTLGNVQIVANAFTSESTQGLLGFDTVFILSLDSATNMTAAVPTLSGLKIGAITPSAPSRQMVLASKPIAARALSADEFKGVQVQITPVAAPAQVFQPPVGSVLFANNHCNLDVPGATGVVASVAIVGLADAQVTGNHFAVTVGSILYPVVVTAATLRVEANRFTEIGAALWSLFGHGVFAIATNNISDHCLQVTGTSGAVVTQNLEVDGGFCGFLGAMPVATGLAVTGAST